MTARFMTQVFFLSKPMFFTCMYLYGVCYFYAMKNRKTSFNFVIHIDSFNNCSNYNLCISENFAIM